MKVFFLRKRNPEMNRLIYMPILYSCSVVHFSHKVNRLSFVTLQNAQIKLFAIMKKKKFEV